MCRTAGPRPPWPLVEEHLQVADRSPQQVAPGVGPLHHHALRGEGDQPLGRAVIGAVEVQGLAGAVALPPAGRPCGRCRGRSGRTPPRCRRPPPPVPRGRGGQAGGELASTRCTASSWQARRATNPADRSVGCRSAPPGRAARPAARPPGGRSPRPARPPARPGRRPGRRPAPGGRALAQPAGVERAEVAHMDGQVVEREVRAGGDDRRRVAGLDRGDEGGRLPGHGVDASRCSTGATLGRGGQVLNSRVQSPLTGSELTAHGAVFLVDRPERRVGVEPVAGGHVARRAGVHVVGEAVHEPGAHPPLKSRATRAPHVSPKARTSSRRASRGTGRRRRPGRRRRTRRSGCRARGRRRR